MSDTNQPQESGQANGAINQQPVAPQQNGSLQPTQRVIHLTVMSPKSVGLAYVLLIFLGGLGIHKFYLDKVGMGVTYLSLTFVGGLLTLIWTGWLLLFAVWVMLIIDLFTLPGNVRTFNARQHAQLNGGAYGHRYAVPRLPCWLRGRTAVGGIRQPDAPRRLQLRNHPRGVDRLDGAGDG